MFANNFRAAFQEPNRRSYVNIYSGSGRIHKIKKYGDYITE